jgi:hypothetical protein
VTSLDDGSTDRARLTTPSDPWLGESPTPAFIPLSPASGNSALVVGPVPDDPPVAAIVPEDPPGEPLPYRPGGRPRSRAALLVLIALAAGALIIAGWLTAGHGTTTARTPSTGAEHPADVAQAPAPVVTHDIVYEVTAGGHGDQGSVSYVDADGDIIRRSGIPLPWRTTFRRDGKAPLVLDAQRTLGGDGGPVSCTITVDGKVVATTTARGKYAAPECSG